jgi:small subunit ribosomal protein S17
MSEENENQTEAEVVTEAPEEPVAEADVPEPAVEPEPTAAAAEPAVEAAAPAEPEAPEAEENAGAAAEEPAAAPSGPKPKKKRLPRSARPPRTKRKREQVAERKPITLVPKPEHPRGRRQERQGTVVSAAADKTIVVRVDVVKAHPTYKKVIKRSTRLHAHDERNEAKPGDVVRIVETRPLSKLKRWRLQEIVEAAK